VTSTSDVTIPTADGPMRAHVAQPAGDPRGALIVVQEAFGVNDHIEDVTRRAAEAGYYAVAPDLFHRSGPGSVVEYGNFEKVMEYFKDVSGDDAVLMDIDGAIEHLHRAGYANRSIGVVGFCFGGRVTFLVALRRSLGGAVGFYGGGIVTGRFPQFPPLIGETPRLRTPWLGLFGDQDASIAVDDVEQLRGALEATSVDTEVVRYPDAGHGFHCDQRPDYRPGDAKDAWGRALSWFRAHLR
jgi:carboxymethylenebutenolidase